MAEQQQFCDGVGKSFNYIWRDNLYEDIKNFTQVLDDRERHGERYVGFIRALKYWDVMLRTVYDSCRFMFTTYNEQTNVRIDPAEVIKKVAKIIGKENIKGIYFPRNPKYMGIDVKDNKYKLLLEQYFIMVQECHVIPADWGAAFSNFKIRIHWYPQNEDMKELVLQLEKYAHILDINNEKLYYPDDIEIYSSVLIVKAAVKDKIIIEDIPHLLKVNNITVLITIPGREPLCLKCKEIGHKSVDCKLKICRKCKQKYLEKHDRCSFAKSYAEAATVQNQRSADVLMETDIFTESEKGERNDKMDGSTMRDDNLKLQQGTDGDVNEDCADSIVNTGDFAIMCAGYSSNEHRESNMACFAEVNVVLNQNGGYDARIRKGAKGGDGINAKQKDDNEVEQDSLTRKKETRLKQNDARDYWGKIKGQYDVYESRAKTAKAGMAILVKKKSAVKVVVVNGINERMMQLMIKTSGSLLTMINVHFPIVLSARLVYYRQLHRIIKGVANDEVIIVGDWNINNDVKQRVYQAFMDKHGMYDLALMKKKERLNTRVAGMQSGNRLDRVVISQYVGMDFDYKVLCCPMSDHHMIKCEYKLEVNFKMDNNRRGVVPVWDEKLLSDVQAYVQGIIDEMNLCFSPEAEWSIRKNLSYQCARERQCQQEKQISIELSGLYSKINVLLNDQSGDRQVINQCKLRIEQLEVIRHKRMVFKVKKNKYLTANTPKNIIFKWLKTEKKRSQVNILKINDCVYSENSKIVNYMQEYHMKQQLECNGYAREFNDFCKPDKYKLRVAKNCMINGDVVDQEKLNREITMDELNDVLNGGKKIASPGPDGVTSQFYRGMNNQFKVSLLGYFNYLLNEEKREVLLKQNEVFLKMFPKGKGESPVVDVQNVRPISLINEDLKLLAKIMLMRIAEPLDGLLMKNIYGIRGRSIQRAIFYHHLAFNEYNKKSREQLMILRVDMKKAFDMVNMDYMDYVLLKYLGNNKTTELIRGLIRYKAVAFLNGKVHANFQVMENALLQGSPLSAALYSLYLFEVIVNIEMVIKGIWIGGKLEQIKTISYIDDVSVFLLNNREFKLVFQIFKDFEEITGSVISWNKSYVYSIKENKLKWGNLLGGKHGKILGMNFPIINAKRAGNEFMAREWNRIANKLEIIKQATSDWREKVNLINVTIISMLAFHIPFIEITNKMYLRLNAAISKALFGKFKILAMHKVYYPIKKGGFQLTDIRILSRSMMFNLMEKVKDSSKLISRYLQYPELINDGLVKKWIVNYKGMRGKMDGQNLKGYKQWNQLFLKDDVKFKGYSNRMVNLKKYDKFKFKDNTINFVYKCRLGILPTKENLKRRKIYHGTGECVFCQKELETFEHLFSQCEQTINSIRKYGEIIAGDFDINSFIKRINFDMIPDNVFKFMITMMFAIWKCRCSKVFGNYSRGIEQTIEKQIKEVYYNDIFCLNENVVKKLWSYKLRKCI